MYFLYRCVGISMFLHVFSVDQLPTEWYGDALGRVADASGLRRHARAFPILYLYADRFNEYLFGRRFRDRFELYFFRSPARYDVFGNVTREGGDFGCFGSRIFSREPGFECGFLNWNGGTNAGEFVGTIV